MPKITEAERERRFWARVDRNGPNGCWLWIGRLDTKGYGLWDPRWRRPKSAHITAYEWTRGPVPAGLELDHLCRVPACVNPDHLEPVTKLVNIRRGVSPSAINARKTHCRRGHPFDRANTIPYVDSKGREHRRCRNCEALPHRRRVA